MTQTFITFELILTLFGVSLATCFFLFFYYQKQKKELAEHKGGSLRFAELNANYQNLSVQYEQLKADFASQEEALRESLQFKGQFHVLSEALQKTEKELQRKQTNLESMQSVLTDVRQSNAELSERLIQQQRQAEEKIALLENAKQQLTNEFKLLANQLFDEKQKLFTQTSKSSIEALLKPMSHSLDQFRQRIESTHKEDLEGRASLKEQLHQLQKLNSQMSEETQNLTQALKGESKTQGNWGELILERLLERSGLREGEEFIREKSFTNEEGKRLRPDVVLNLPDNKHIIIDSKVSLTDYERALSAEQESGKTRAIKAHLLSLKSHIDALASKRYEHLEQINAPDFVLMFIPIEAAYMMAIEEDSRIFEDAFDKRVAVVTPTTLFTTLKTIEQLWRYERQSENTVKLIQRAADVHDKFVGFVGNFEKVGTQISQAQNSYEEAFKQLSTGRGNLIRQAQMLKELAGKTKKEIPEHLLQETSEKIENLEN